MSHYPPPPGSTPQTHGLPPRPPPVAGGSGFNFKPRNVSNAPATSAAAPPVSTAAAQQYAHPYGSHNMSASTYPTANASQYQYPQGDAYAGAYGNTAQYGPGPTPPQMQNPFAPPTQNSYNGSLYGSAYNAEEAAAIAQWQSQFGATTDKKTTKTTGNANLTPLGGAATTQSTTAAATSADPVADAKKTVVRKGGGQTWEDNTLLEWGNHHRLFIGNLAGEVTDESLLKAFSKYPSVQKARVVRDKRTTKSKGFGFVSLADADEFFQAAKEMQGKYIGSHPVLVKKAETEIKTVNKKDDRGRGNHKGHNNNKNNKKGGDESAKSHNGVLGPSGGAGVKKAAKSDSKYKVLG